MVNGSSSVRFIGSPVALVTRGGGGDAPSLRDVITHAIDQARSQGLDEIQQYHSSVRAVRRVEPDLPLLVAARLINALLEEQDDRGDRSRYAGVAALHPVLAISNG
jgi:hypothetical protein